VLFISAAIYDILVSKSVHMREKDKLRKFANRFSDFIFLHARLVSKEINLEVFLIDG
jgi:cob(I)alamin adenosyltransferase